LYWNGTKRWWLPEGTSLPPGHKDCGKEVDEKKKDAVSVEGMGACRDITGLHAEMPR